MSDRLAESSNREVSEIIEIALYCTSVLLIVLLWICIPA
jgi:hypothetical protein